MPTERDLSSALFPLGSHLPAFDLPSAQGSHVTDSFLREGKVGLVVFGCNHCPYVIGSEEMLIDIVRRYSGAGLRSVVISSNDAAQYPEDSFAKMKEKASREDLPYPYLYDESQHVARAFDAQCTPECYLFDSSGILVYHGGINDNPRNSDAVKVHALENAISQLLSGTAPSPAFVHPIGCSIKWKQ